MSMRTGRQVGKSTKYASQRKPRPPPPEKEYANLNNVQIQSPTSRGETITRKKRRPKSEKPRRSPEDKAPVEGNNKVVQRETTADTSPIENKDTSRKTKSRKLRKPKLDYLAIAKETVPLKRLPYLDFSQAPMYFRKTPAPPFEYSPQRATAKHLKRLKGCFHDSVWTDLILDIGPQRCTSCRKIHEGRLVQCPECGLMECHICKNRNWGGLMWGGGLARPDGLGRMRPMNIIKKKQREEKVKEMMEEDIKKGILQDENYYWLMMFDGK